MSDNCVHAIEPTELELTQDCTRTKALLRQKKTADTPRVYNNTKGEKNDDYESQYILAPNTTLKLN